MGELIEFSMHFGVLLVLPLLESLQHVKGLLLEVFLCLFVSLALFLHQLHKFKLVVLLHLDLVQNIFDVRMHLLEPVVDP